MRARLPSLRIGEVVVFLNSVTHCILSFLNQLKERTKLKSKKGSGRIRIFSRGKKLTKSGGFLEFYVFAQSKVCLSSFYIQQTCLLELDPFDER